MVPQSDSQTMTLQICRALTGGAADFVGKTKLGLFANSGELFPWRIGRIRRAWLSVLLHRRTYSITLKMITFTDGGFCFCAWDVTQHRGGVVLGDLRGKISECATWMPCGEHMMTGCDVTVILFVWLGWIVFLWRETIFGWFFSIWGSFNQLKYPIHELPADAIFPGYKIWSTPNYTTNVW